MNSDISFRGSQIDDLTNGKKSAREHDEESSIMYNEYVLFITSFEH